MKFRKVWNLMYCILYIILYYNYALCGVEAVGPSLYLNCLSFSLFSSFRFYLSSQTFAF